MSNWTVEQSRKLYNIERWGNGYFDINEQGNVIVRPDQQRPEHTIDLFQLIDEIQQHGLISPVLARFPDILHHRVNTLREAFTSACQQHQYQGEYTPVYPIKVNQEFSVVNELTHTPLTATQKQRVGLEAGSKTELMAVLAVADANNGIIVCNGYKDREYIRLALIGTRLGHRLFIVLEKLSELELILAQSRELGIEPMLGIRARMSSIGHGKWQNTGGEKSKFGLSANQVLQVIDTLKQRGKLQCLQLLHFHLGSQIADIKDIDTGMSECTQYYKQLHQLGVPLQYVDVGGGLGVDYEGTRSEHYFSINYSVQNYANRIVAALARVSTEHHLPHAHIITESGRAMTAHHTLLIMNVIDIDQYQTGRGESDLTTDNKNPLESIYSRVKHNDADPVLEYHNATQQLAQLQQDFIAGKLSLAQKVAAEHCYHHICETIAIKLSDIKSKGGNTAALSSAQAEVLDMINEKLADKYFCNFSLFQSIPDTWAIDQIFPIMPLHRLEQKPDRRATLHDITCDSDGRISYYVGKDGVESSIPLHNLRPDAPYYLGIFLIGAYQETLGDMHNLFGDTNSIDIELTQDGYTLKHSQLGDTVDYVLRHIHFEPERLMQSYRTKLHQSQLSNEEYNLFLTELKSGLYGYTYLED